MKTEQQRTQREERPKRETAHAAPSRHSAVAVTPGCAFDGMGNRAVAALLRSGRLQRKARSAAPANPPDDTKRPLSNAVELLGQLDGGRELNRSTREEMEAGFRQSFSDVRIHTGHRAADAAAMFQARAFTAANDIVFGDGEFAPETTEGRRLLAHELAHVAQQKGPEGKARPGTPMAKLSISEAADPLEREADAAADSVLAGRRPVLNVPSQVAMPAISRQAADKPKKGQTPQDFTVEKDHGQNNSYYIRFPHFISEDEAYRILFAHGKVPDGVTLKYQGPMRGGWTFELRSTTAGGIGLGAFVEFAPILAKQFHPDTLSLTAEETAARRKTQEEFLDSKPVYLGGQTVREAMTLEHCKDHLVPGQVGMACWGERAGYFYWVGFDSYHRGVTLEVKSSPHTEKVIKDWEWFLSHSPADYVPHVKDLPYAATFNPDSKASFTLGEAELLENELSNWEFTHEIQAWVGVMQATAGAVGSLRTPAPSTLTGQSLTVAGKGIQTYEAWKAAAGGDQSELDMLLMGLGGALEQGAGMIGNLSGRPPKRPGPVEDSPHGTSPRGMGKTVVAHGADTDVAAGEGETVRAAPSSAGHHDELAAKRAARAAAAAEAKLAAKAKVVAQAAQRRVVRAAAGGESGGGGSTEVGSVETTVEGGTGGSRTVGAGGTTAGTKEPAFQASAPSDPEAVTQALADAGFTPEEIAGLGEENVAGLNARAAKKVALLGKHFTTDDLRALAQYLAGTRKVLNGRGAQMLVDNVGSGDMKRFLATATQQESMPARPGVAPGVGTVRPRLRLVEPEPDTGGLGPALVHLTPMTPEEMFDVLVSQRAFTFNERGGAANIDPRALGPGGQVLDQPPPGLGANVGPAAGGRAAGGAVFAVVEVVDSSGRAVIRGAGQFLGGDDLHAEQSALAGLETRLGGHAPEIEGGELKVVVDQLPCGPESANCSLALQRFANAYGLRLRVFVPERAAVGRPNAAVRPRASTMGSQGTGMPPVHMREMDAAELEHEH